MLAITADNGDRQTGNHWVTKSSQLADLAGEAPLLDAYGVLRLASGHALPLAPRWTRSELTGGDTLATHVDPAAWFSEDTIDPTVLADARVALDGHIIDRTGERMLTS